MRRPSLRENGGARPTPSGLPAAVGLLTLLVCLTPAGPAVLANPAAGGAPTPARSPAPDSLDSPTFHPGISLLDAQGVNVLQSGAAVSPMTTCGSCHDTDYIATHSSHRSPARQGLGGAVRGPGDALLESTAWNEPGAEEMNCFVCHLADPDLAARQATLEGGLAGWAPTATLGRTGVVSGTGAAWTWRSGAFDADGTVHAARLGLGDPGNLNCAACHGLVHTDLETPFSQDEPGFSAWNTLSTGQVVSPQKMDRSGLNLDDKHTLDRPWDVHAERLVDCVDCHHSVNNPIYYREDPESRPDHLTFDARRMELGDYLRRPSHVVAHGSVGADHGAAEGSIGSASMRRCDSCHSIEATHDWLPYKTRHMAALACETCHIPTVMGPALQSVDWTLVGPDGEPRREFRGFEGSTLTAATPLHGYRPVLLPRRGGGALPQLAPHNLVTVFTWVAGEPAEPIGPADLREAFTAGGAWRPEVLGLLDADGDGRLRDSERVLAGASAVDGVQYLLTARGFRDPRIRTEVQAFPIHHGVIGGTWATRDCAACHQRDSRLAGPFPLAGSAPLGAQLQKLTLGAAGMAGSMEITEAGGLGYTPDLSAAGFYVLGHDSVRAVNLIGLITVLAVLTGILLHGGLRWLRRRRVPASQRLSTRRVYMYSAYERLWHWLQAAAILILIVTGLEVHFAGGFSLLGFDTAVRVHNVVAVIVVVNALFAAFYHFASGEIRQYLPAPRGFFSQAITQTTFYLRGIFRHEPHPFEKEPGRKLNPLQQVTYLAILNVLLPLQVITGVLLWGMQHWPEVALRLGGLSLVAPAHALLAWLFTAFLIMHLYLTTTGHSPTANVKAMVVGWEDVEAPAVARASGVDHDHR